MSSQTVLTNPIEKLRAVRAQTVQLFDLVTSEAVLRSEPMPGFRPLLWHLAHIGVYQNYWLLQRCAGQTSINPKYDTYFDPIKTPREEAPRLPQRGEIDAYLDETMRRVEDFLASTDFRAEPGRDRLTPSYATNLVLEHECQHQETLAFVMQSLPLEAKKRGAPPVEGSRGQAASEIMVPGIRVPVGALGAGFAYDNELPRHEVLVEAFHIDRDLTTNAEFREFIDAGGYARAEWWSEPGWHWKESAGVDRPLYWSREPYRERSFFADTKLRGDAPVTGVSWYEAAAYAAYRGKRLPTEFEWEVAAAWDARAGKMRRFTWGDAEPADRTTMPTFATSPVGALTEASSALGMHDAWGNLWQWTASPFCGYPGFRPYPYPEYSASWFDGDHFVARGGSWYTWPALTRTSFRNFYRRHFRPAFIGIRCARDAR
jgi:iron(II)-dependent oxidoreductase